MAIFYTDTGSISRLEITGSLEVTSSTALIKIGETLASTNDIYSIQSASVQVFKIDRSRNVFLSGSFYLSGSTSITNDINITGSLTASLQQGYVWVGNASGKTITVATSSFGGGSGVTGGTTNYIPLWTGATSLSMSVMYQANNNIGVNKNTPDARFQIYSSGSAVFSVSGSTGELFRINDSGSNAPIMEITSGSTDVILVDAGGTMTASVKTNALYYSTVYTTPSTDQNDFSPAGWNSSNPLKASVISISGSNSIKISGLAGGEEGRIATFKNNSTDFVVVLEDNSTLSQAANRFDLRNPIFLIPNSSVTFIYDTVHQKWEPIASSGIAAFNTTFNEYSDFIGTQTALSTTAINIDGTPFWGVANGTGASGQTSTYLYNTTEKPLGVYEIDAGTTATGRAHIGNTNMTEIIPTYGQALFLTRLAVDALSSATDRYQIFAGWHDSVGATVPTDGVYWQYHDGSSSAWQGAKATGGTRTFTGVAGPTVDTNYIWLGIYVNPTWTKASYFYSTDSVTYSMAGTHSLTITNAQTVGFGVTINKTIGTTSRLCAIDLMGHRYDISRG